MASQNVRYIDLQKSYVPVDPNSFPESLAISGDFRDDKGGVLVYDGKNFLPTAYGYKSYFGLTQEHPADLLAERVDWVLIYQNESMNNIMFALCDSGIWYKAGDTDGAWTQSITLPDYRGTDEHHEWTYCILDNNLYCYRANGAKLYKIESDAVAPGFTLTELTPNFLNMSAQMGIFRAGNRLGFWDSDNSVAWSNLDDFTDFTADLVTLAGSSKFTAVIGRIISIKTHGEGFIIYATKSITYIDKAVNSLFLWEPTRILENCGIAYAEEVTEALPNTIHYANTTVGIYKIENAKPELVLPDVRDFFSLTYGPKYIKLVQGRYLFFENMDPNFATATPIQTDFPIPPLTVTITAETFEAMFAQTQGGSPTLSFTDFINATQLGYFMDMS